jgi:hypothetical protein
MIGWPKINGRLPEVTAYGMPLDVNVSPQKIYKKHFNYDSHF